MQRLRLFIALELPHELRSSVLKSFERLPLDRSAFRVTPDHNLHITLKFIGERDINELDGLIEVLENAAIEMEAPDISLEHVLLLPPARPRTLAVGIAVTDTLQNIFASIDGVVADLGIAQPEHRRFAPHITLARLTQQLQPDAYAIIQKWQLPPVFCRATTLTLFESVLRPRGPEYTPLKRIALA